MDNLDKTVLDTNDERKHFNSIDLYSSETKETYNRVKYTNDVVKD